MINTKIKTRYSEKSNRSLNSHMDYDRRPLLRKKAIEEILTSEERYLIQLEMLMNYFVLPSKNLIDISSHVQLFGQLELIYNINSELLKCLKEDLNNVAYAFLKFAPFFKIYSVYAFDYKNSLILLQHLTSKNSEFKKFLQKTEQNPEVERTLNSLLITPIQRVPRYRLLLQQILFYTSPADGDYKSIQRSIKQIELTIDHINSVVEDQENTQTLLNIQNSLVNRTPHIIRPSRRLIKEGILFKYSANGVMMKRYCILCSDIFMYCKIVKERKSPMIMENSLECSCIFPLKKCKVKEIFAGKFKLSCLSEGIILCSEDVQTGRGWIKALQETIDVHIEYRKTIRKDSSKRKPMRKKEIKKFDKLEAYSGEQSQFEKIYYGLNESYTNILSDDEQSNGCFSSTSCNLLKRKINIQSKSHKDNVKSFKYENTNASNEENQKSVKFEV